MRESKEFAKTKNLDNEHKKAVNHYDPDWDANKGVKLRKLQNHIDKLKETELLLNN